MSKDYLLWFLEKRIFTLKSGDDQLLEKLRKAVNAVLQVIKDNRLLTIPYTLAALDPETPVDDPTFEAVASAVQHEWNTYTEVFTQPRTVFRAIILDALARLGEEDHEVSGAVDLIARNMLPHIQSGGETEILTKFRDRAREISQLEAEQRWPTDPRVTVPKLPSIKLGQLNGSAVTVNRDSLRAGFPRPAWNTNNWMAHDQQLFDMITNQGVEAIASTVEAAVKTGGISSTDLKKSLTDPLEKGMKELLDSVATSLSTVIAPMATLKRQAEILWWKEAAFSEHLQQSYRTIPAVLLPFAFAVDFAALLPAWSPIAVEHFLAEAFRVQSVPGSAKSKTVRANLRTYLDHLKTESQTSQLLDQLPEAVEDCAGRSTLLSFVRAFSHGKADLEKLLARTGLSPSLEIANTEMCLHLFREIQASRLLAPEQNGDAQ